MIRSLRCFSSLLLFPLAASSFTPLHSTQTSWQTSSSVVSSSRIKTAIAAEATASTSALTIEQVQGEDRVLDVASFRNGICNPQQMVEKAQAKRDAIDTTAAALDGLKVGLLYVGPPLAILQYLQDSNILDALATYVVVGGLIGGLLAVNNAMGRSVHVPDVPEATNRILVDFAEGLLREQDMGWVAVTNDSVYEAASGVCACVDVQHRNSPNSPSGVRTVPDLPSHYHIKNMLVDIPMQRKGIGMALLQAIEEHARAQSDAKALTLEVEGLNLPAVGLYNKAGFKAQKNPSKLSRNTFMVKSLE